MASQDRRESESLGRCAVGTCRRPGTVRLVGQFAQRDIRLLVCEQHATAYERHMGYRREGAHA